MALSIKKGLCYLCLCYLFFLCQKEKVTQKKNHYPLYLLFTSRWQNKFFLKQILGVCWQICLNKNSSFCIPCGISNHISISPSTKGHPPEWGLACLRSRQPPYHCAPAGRHPPTPSIERGHSPQRRYDHPKPLLRFA